MSKKSIMQNKNVNDHKIIWVILFINTIIVKKNAHIICITNDPIISPSPYYNNKSIKITIKKSLPIILTIFKSVLWIYSILVLIWFNSKGIQ